MRNLIFRVLSCAIVAIISSATLLGSVALFDAPAYASPAILIDETSFPDGVFRSYVKSNYDANGDNYLDDTAQTATDMDVSGYWPEESSKIDSLKGIEYFPALEKLYCGSNRLSSLDISANTKLVELDCSWNQLGSLDLSQNPALQELDCYKNRLASLDISQNPALRILNCGDNQLGSLDLSQNPALQVLSCGYNQLVSLDVTNNTVLERLFVYENQLTSLTIGQNPVLNWLHCSGNQLTSLDVTKNQSLGTLDCNNNQLASLDVTKNQSLGTLYCNNNQLASLDVTKNQSLRTLYCNNNQLTSLDLSQNQLLWTLYCNNNQLYDIVGAGSFVQGAGHQSLTVPVVADPDNPGSYVSVNRYPLAQGRSIALASGACYDTVSERFSADTLDSPYAFKTTMPASEVTGEIRFVLPTPFSVSFKDWDGSELSSGTVRSGDAALPPADPSRPGHRFIGWDLPFDNVTADLTVTAVYEEILHTVSFKDWDGSELSSKSVRDGDAALPPADPSRPGHRFVGWDLSFDNVTADLTVTAVYEADAPEEPEMLRGIAGSIGSGLGGGLVLDVEGGSTTPGAPLIAWGAHSLANQRFVLVPDGEGYYWIVCVGTGMALDASGASAAAGTAVVQWPRHDGDNQKWKLRDLGNGEYLIISKLDENMCIDAAVQASGGAKLVLWPVHGGANQRFTLDATSPAAQGPALSQSVVLRSGLPVKGGAPSLVADIHSGALDNGAAAIAWPAHGGQNQRFELAYSPGTGYYTIMTYGGVGNKALDVAGGRLTAETPVIQWDAHGGVNQLWYIEDAGNNMVYIRSAANGMALDVAKSAGAGSQLIIWPLHGGANQRWELV